MQPLSNILDRSADGQSVLNDLRRKIVFQEYVKGDPISEVKLANDYGVSRNVIRQVLQVLINENLVVLLSNGRKEILGFDLDYVNNHYDMREALECQAAKAIVSSSRENLTPLKQAYNLLADVRFCTIEQFYELRDLNNSEIHFALIRSSGNPLLIRHYSILEPMITTVTHLNSLNEEHIKKSQMHYIRRHTLLLDSALSRKANLVELVEKHVEEARQDSLCILKNFFKTPNG